MAKTKRTNTTAPSAHGRESASQRRERQRDVSSTSTTSNATRRTSQQRRRVVKRRSPWPYVIGTLVVLAALIAIFVFVSRQSTTTNQGQGITPANKTTFQEVTNVSPAILAQVGTGNIIPPFSTPSGSPPALTGSTGKPEVFYYGGEFCPYCAAERWGVVVALSRFGTFHSLNFTTSSSTDVYPDTSTFTFYKSSYSSSYIDFAPIEGTDRQQQPLQSLTSDEQNLVSTYDTSNSIPFMDIGNKYLVTQQSYSPGVLRSDAQNPNSSPLSQQQIASQLSSVNTISKGILGEANYMTAAICSLTNNQPSAVCSASYIKSIEASLAQSAQVSPQSAKTLIALVAHPFIADIPHESLVSCEIKII